MEAANKLKLDVAQTKIKNAIKLVLDGAKDDIKVIRPSVKFGDTPTDLKAYVQLIKDGVKEAKNSTQTEKLFKLLDAEVTLIQNCFEKGHLLKETKTFDTVTSHVYYIGNVCSFLCAYGLLDCTKHKPSASRDKALDFACPPFTCPTSMPTWKKMTAGVLALMGAPVAAGALML